MINEIASGNRFIEIKANPQEARPLEGQGEKPVFSTFLRSTDQGRNLERIQAQRKLSLKAGPLHKKIGNALMEMRKLFADAGMPIIDMVNFKRSPNGAFKIRGWGKGVPVSHPQAKFIEAILNGTAPRFAGLTDKVTALVDKMENLFGQVQDLKEDGAQLSGKMFFRKSSFFDGNVTMGSEHLDHIQGEAKTLSLNEGALFGKFKKSLGVELDMLSYEQILSRFHFSAVILPDLGEEFRAYL
jgi:hypothetical protein